MEPFDEEIKKDFLDDRMLRDTLVSIFFLVLLGFLAVEILEWTRFGSYFKIPSVTQRRCFRDIIYGYSSHNGPATWKLSFPESTGENQSPINIDTKCSLVVNPCTSLKADHWDTLPLMMTLQNSGHTVMLMAEWSSDCTPTLTGGPLGDAIYKFSCASFRWGPNNDEGSEHTIDNNRYCLEVQICNTRVITNKDNGSFNDNDIAIVSFLYNITDRDNPYLDYIINNLKKIKCPSQPVWIPPFPLKWLKKTFSSCYYAYSGSLTHPPCSEGVTWIIFPEAVSISAEQVGRFRKLRSHDGELILTNTRPVQLMNSRSVFYYD